MNNALSFEICDCQKILTNRYTYLFQQTLRERLQLLSLSHLSYPDSLNSCKFLLVHFQLGSLHSLISRGSEMKLISAKNGISSGF